MNRTRFLLIVLALAAAPAGSATAATKALLGTIRAGTVILTRDRATADPTGKIFRSSDGALLFDAADLELGTAAGLDITLLSAISQANELEIRYFGIDSWSASRTFDDPGGIRFDGFGVSAPAISQRIDYGSRLYNFEVNFRPRVAEGLPLVLGFRTLQLHEQLELWRLDPLPESVGIGTRANNFLYGLQIGAEPYILGAGGPLRLDGTLKAGVYGNHAHQGTYSPPAGTTVEDTFDRVAFVGELGVAVVYRFSRACEVRAGYQLLWLHGVALAPDQSRSTYLLGPAGGVNCSATSFYQGAAISLGFEF
jgi:hypothetical protein